MTSPALVINLDGTLTGSDLLMEGLFKKLSYDLPGFVRFIPQLRLGKAPFKEMVAQQSAIEPSLLPYNERVIQLIREAKQEGRPVILATATDRHLATRIADHFKMFDGVLASDGVLNLTGPNKAKQLVARFGEHGFDYVGDSASDIEVWRHARKAYVVSASPQLADQAARLGVETVRFETQGPTLRLWLRALRVHQYAKNILVLVPLVTAHLADGASLIRALLAFLAFSLTASSVYVVNDLIDLEADRSHPTKRKRPFASGEIPILHGVLAAPVLAFAGFALALMASPLFAFVLAGYFALTFAYSIHLKRKMMIDVVALATLYTVRVIGGAAAVGVYPSEWLLAFSMFIFTCLALVKRYTELAMRIDNALEDPTNRNYRLLDLPVVGAMAVASGFNAITIFALYLSSPAVQQLYRRPYLLWLICPLLLYWIGRVIVMAHRRLIDEDPIVFAIKDRISHITGALILAIIGAASI